MYLIRSLQDGTIRTVMAHSARGAMKLFRAKFQPPQGDYEVKERGEGDWEETFRILR